MKSYYEIGYMFHNKISPCVRHFLNTFCEVLIQGVDFLTILIMGNPPDALWHPESSGRGYDTDCHFPDHRKNWEDLYQGKVGEEAKVRQRKERGRSFTACCKPGKKSAKNPSSTFHLRQLFWAPSSSLVHFSH